ncbi:MAG: glycosyltransferase family 4 protein [Prolixibacteraceae bacterium]|nr:glycosyltransferase family 4 protein [Prolixibacteraceae bacterium]
MNILQIIPGSGGSFYCGNCLRDSKYVDALRKEGHQVIKIPMYLPLFSDERDLSDIPVFYGAVSIYLKQMFPFLRKAPAWFDKLLNTGPVLKLAASMAGSTNATGLEEMTVSMLMGEEGEQKEELERMVDWMAEHCKPDIIHISNALLLGLAKRIRERIDVPIVCSLQDEDVWVDVMKPSYRERIWKLMQEKSADVDAFIAVSHFFARVMEERMALPREKVFPIYLGVDPDEYEFIPSSGKNRNIGYISRMCHENGFDLVVDAFILLRQQAALSDVKLIATGGYTAADHRFLKAQKEKIVRAGLSGEVIFHDAFEGEGRKEFFRKAALATVPVRNGEAFGMYLPELMASGIPIVQPALGAFPEIVSISGGGSIYSPNTPEKLAEAWADLLYNRDALNALSHQARKGVSNSFNIHDHAREMIDLYHKVRENRVQKTS